MNPAAFVAAQAAIMNATHDGGINIAPETGLAVLGFVVAVVGAVAFFDMLRSLHEPCAPADTAPQPPPGWAAPEATPWK